MKQPVPEEVDAPELEFIDYDCGATSSKEHFIILLLIVFGIVSLTLKG